MQDTVGCAASDSGSVQGLCKNDKDDCGSVCSSSSSSGSDDAPSSQMKSIQGRLGLLRVECAIDDGSRQKKNEEVAKKKLSRIERRVHRFFVQLAHELEEIEGIDLTEEGDELIGPALCAFAAGEKGTADCSSSTSLSDEDEDFNVDSSELEEEEDDEDDDTSSSSGDDEDENTYDRSIVRASSSSSAASQDSEKSLSSVEEPPSPRPMFKLTKKALLKNQARMQQKQKDHKKKRRRVD